MVNMTKKRVLTEVNVIINIDYYVIIRSRISMFILHLFYVFKRKTEKRTQNNINLVKMF